MTSGTRAPGTTGLAHERASARSSRSATRSRACAWARVGNAWLWSACGECEYCETGWETLCPQQKNGGYSVDGSFGQYMLVDSRYCPVIPDGVDLSAVGPILCAGVTVYKGLKVTDTQPGEWMLVSGSAGSGTSRCSTRSRWAAASPRWTSTTRSSRSRASTARR